LTENELKVLEYLVNGRCLSEKHSISFKAIEGDLIDEIPDLQEVLDGLIMKYYVGSKKKKATNYYAAAGPSIRALQAHGVVIRRGGRGPL